MDRPGRSRHVGVRFLPGPFLFHSFSGKMQQSLSDIAVAPPEVLGYNFDLAVRQGGFLTDAHNSDIKIISKIENQEGVDNIDEIIDACYGIKIGRASCRERV